MQNEIKKVQDYFKAKILAQDFVVQEVSESTTKIVVDSEYMFFIWTGNRNIPLSYKNAKNDCSFMDLQFTPEESLVLQKVILPFLLTFNNFSL